jgi:acetoin utilization protein AcuB
MIARDLMTPDPLTVTPQASIAEAWDLMRELAVRHVPVVEDGVLVGMLSDRDLARVSIAQVLRVEGADALREELKTPIVEVMSTDVISVEPETEVGEVIGLLLEHKIGALPVVEAGTREVLGIISYVDVLRALLGLVEED